MSKSPKGDYAVGRGRPPLHTRFQPGQSGNLAGRPRHTQSFATVLRRALMTKISVSEHGRHRKITKLEAITTQLVNQAAQANMPAMRLLTGLVQFHQDHADQPSPGELGIADQKVMKELMERVRTLAAENDHDG
jgi:hypothetical protein